MRCARLLAAAIPLGAFVWSTSLSGCFFPLGRCGEGIECDTSSAVVSSSSTSASTVSSSASGAPVDVGFKHAAWTTLALDVAVDPSSRSPLVWTPCASGAPGCEVASFPTDAVPKATVDYSLIVAASPSVIAAAREVDFQSGGTFETEVDLYDAGTGAAIGAFRTRDQRCNLFPQLSATRAFLDVFDDTSEVFAFAAPSDLETSPTTAAIEALGDYLVADDAVLLQPDANSPRRFDLATKTTLSLEAKGELYQPHFGGDFDLAVLEPNDGTNVGAIWSKGGSGFAPLVDAAPDRVVDIASDGETLVWVLTEAADDDDAPFALDLWTSPMTTTKDALVPTKRRAFPASEVSSSIAADGFYAASGDALELYRLSDMAHWTLAIPDEQLTRFVAVDSDYIYVSGTISSFRLAIADLGASD